MLRSAILPHQELHIPVFQSHSNAITSLCTLSELYGWVGVGEHVCGTQLYGD
jgi:hypothetical protein